MSSPAPAPSDSAHAPPSELGISPCCLKGNQFDGTPRGSMIRLGGLDTYIASSPDGKAPKEGRVVVLLYDIFGLGIKNPKIIADELSKRLGVIVYVPDYLEGAWVPESALVPFLKDTPTSTPGFWSSSILGKLSSVGGVVSNTFSVIKAIRSEASYGRVEKFIRHLRTEKGVTHVGAVGFCLGGTQAAYAACDPTLIDAAVIAHPGVVPEAKLYADNKVPTSWIFAEDDQMLDLTKQAKLVEYQEV